ncbi:MAG: citrate/2-methylcitrate synthase, partial [Chloroflexota bacterium]
MTQAGKKGLDGVSIGPSRLSLVNGTEGKLVYAGYKIEDLAANASYEEVVYLLWNDRLPNQAELEQLRAAIAEQAVVYPEVIQHLKEYPKAANSMAVLRTAVSELSFYDPDAEDTSLPALQRKAIRMTGQVTTICAAWARIRKGQEPVAPRKDLALSANFMYMLTGQEPEKTAVDAIDAYMVLLTEHGMNAS